MAHYDAELNMRDARAEYFDRNNFKDGGYDGAWLSLKIGPIPFGFPNTRARVRAVKLHDLHHVLTEYDTTWTGEAEIGGWEIASGCGRHYAAWILNMGAFAIGMVIAPRKVYMAFLRGRRNSNLYDGPLSDELLARGVGQLRKELNLNSALSKASAHDNLAFFFWAVTSVVVSASPYSIAMFVVAIFTIRFLHYAGLQ